MWTHHHCSRVLELDTVQSNSCCLDTNIYTCDIFFNQNLSSHRWFRLWRVEIIYQKVEAKVFQDLFSVFLYFL